MLLQSIIYTFTKKTLYMNFVSEMKWRNMINDLTPGIEEELSSRMSTGYVGFDPTAPSLHIGSLAPIMLLMHASGIPLVEESSRATPPSSGFAKQNWNFIS